MGWSTRQLAELAGTTLRAVRHYHDVGLLAEPERRANGYKSYGVAHLVRVLRITRLTGLGLSLKQITELGEADEHPEEALRALDIELAASIERLRGMRAEIAVILDRSASTDLPPDLARVVADAEVPATDRSMAVVMSQVLGQSVLDAYAAMLRTTGPDATLVEFDRLPADADERTRQALAERMVLVPAVRKVRTEFPSVQELCADAPRGEDFAVHALGLAALDLYNPAQIDVLIRMNG